jgi:hypothetical protein
VIECIATDHAPHARHEKEVPFEQAPMGTTGLETAFAALYTELVLPGVLPLELLIERMTAGGALYGLPTPQIAVGREANLCLIDLDASWRSARRLRSRSANCCFTAASCSGRVLLTVAPAARSPSRERASLRAERRMSYATLRALEDGARFDGLACGADGHAVGEIVFTPRCRATRRR